MYNVVDSILAIWRPSAGCDYHRTYLPLHYMGYKHFNLTKEEETKQDFRIVYFNRLPNENIIKFLKIRQDRGWKLVADYDDWLDLPPNHLLYHSFQKNKTFDQSKVAMMNADLVTVTTERLAEKVRQFNKNVHVIPNCLPFGMDQFTEIKSESTHTRFMYAGGNTHFWDIQLLKIPFQKLNAAKCGNFEVVLAGYNAGNETSLAFWNKMERSFNLNGKMKNYVRAESKSLRNYMDHYVNCDVSLIPLVADSFSGYKSNLKIIEAGCKNIPVICSDVPPYSDFPNRDLIMYANNARTWFEHMKYCADNPNFVKEKGLALGEYVRQHFDLFKANKYRKQLFESLLI